MASIAEHRIHSRYGIDMAASSIALVLGMSALLMLYLGYAGLSPLAVAVGVVMLVAALMVGVQACRRSQAPHADMAVMMRAITEAMPQAITVKNVRGEILFTNSAARNKNNKDIAASSFQRFPWLAADGHLLGWVEMAASAGDSGAIMPSLSEQDVESLVAQRTAEVRELIAHIETCREEEKKALARKLHGELGSSLTAISMHLAILSRQLPEAPPLHDRLRDMRELLRSAAEVARQIQSGLRPDKLELFGMRVAIEDLADTISHTSGIAFDLNLPEESASYPAHLEIAVYRMLEQLLSNITQHAYATQVDIVMAETDDTLELLVNDNGVGFYPHETPAGAYGLCSLRERAAYLGGKAEVQSTPGKGTQVRIVLPLQREPDALQQAL